MQLYSAKVQIGGSRDNEVVMQEVTIPEIIVLRKVHKGEEHVLNIKPLGREAFDSAIGDDEQVKKTLRTDKSERARLERLYPKVKLSELFGIGVPLPQVIDGLDGAVDAPARRKKAPEPEAELGAMA